MLRRGSSPITRSSVTYERCNFLTIAPETGAKVTGSSPIFKIRRGSSKTDLGSIRVRSGKPTRIETLDFDDELGTTIDVANLVMYHLITPSIVEVSSLDRPQEFSIKTLHRKKEYGIRIRADLVTA
ncbi:hypothetical protein PIB30_070096 [Stylosanthes scabra]|uniref:Uncharacterized protein n=1 Tax=Stylosanthes scabra TaxID=79078 RepID=A0ABU6TPX2_9FABA|nr:hypothetical protein [Stylosanthes scabra]